MYIFHIDVNSAYLSWSASQLLEDGGSIDLREIPSVVGGDPLTRHGIVLAKSIPAKKYNIKTGESLYQTRQKCSNLMVAPPDYALYMRCSDALYRLLFNYSPLIQRYSVDECFLAIESQHFSMSDAYQLGEKIKKDVQNKLGFTVNVGLSNNKLLAKMASNLQKPNYFHTMFPEEIPNKLWPLPVKALFMVGSATNKKLKKMNIQTIGQLAKTDSDLLYRRFKSHGLLIHSYANGCDHSVVRPNKHLAQKSISNTTTTSFDVCTKEEAYLVLLALCERASYRLREINQRTSVLAISLKNTEFIRYSHQKKQAIPLDETMAIFKGICHLFDTCWRHEPLRHLGVHLEALISNDFYQISFLDPKDRAKMQSLDQTIDLLRYKYGETSLIRSCFLESGLEPLQGGVQGNDYPMMSSIL